MLVLDQVGTRGGAGDEKERFDARLGLVTVVHLSRDCFSID